MDKGMKYKRSTTEQLEIYKSFVRAHPEIQNSRSDHIHPRRMEYLWNILSERLNSVKGPTRTPKKWKETMMHRKNQLLCRSRKHKADKYETGGGSLIMGEFNSFDQRSMEPVGRVELEGGPSRMDGFSSFEQRSMETMGKAEIGGGTSRVTEFSSFEHRSVETVGKVDEIGGGPSRMNELNSFDQKSTQSAGNVFDGLTNSTWVQQSEGTLETEFDEESMGDGPSATEKPKQHSTAKSRKHRSAHKNSNKLMKETFNTLNNILKTQQTEEDDCDLYVKLLAKKLRQYPPFERQEVMHEIDGILIKRNRHRLSQPVKLYDTHR